MHVNDVDPSLIVGFLIKSKVELEVLCYEIDSFNEQFPDAEKLIVTQK